MFQGDSLSTQPTLLWTPDSRLKFPVRNPKTFELNMLLGRVIPSTFQFLTALLGAEVGSGSNPTTKCERSILTWLLFDSSFKAIILDRIRNRLLRMKR